MSKKDEVKSGDVTEVVKEKTVSKKVTKKEEQKTVAAKVNDGKCCRCVSYNKEHKCRNKKSEKCGSYVARKFGCKCFKYND